MRPVVRAVVVPLLLLGGRASAQPAAPVAAACALPADPAAGGRLDEALYNAGVCHEEAGSADAAIATLQDLRARFSRSPLASRALARLGALHARSARYADAAALLEEYARTYPAEPDADRAMSDAVYYRKGLGDDVAAIYDVKDLATSIAAAARTGQIARHFADSLYTAAIPAIVRADKGALDAYCDTLTSVAEPLELVAIEAFAMCLKTSTDLGWFSSWSALCERALGELRPDEFPAANELRAHQAPPTTSFDLEPPVETIP